MSTLNRKTRFFVLVAALLLTVMGTPSAAAQTFEEAVTAYEQGDYATALRGFRIHAARGNARAQFKLGLMYSRGKDVPRDPAEAVRWHRQAAEQQGHADAQFSLGVRYGIGYGVPQDYAEALRWHRRAAEQGHASAQTYLGSMYAKGKGTPQDPIMAVRWFRRSAEQGHALAQFNLGLMYYKGESGPQDFAEAARWFRLAAEQGHADAQFSLGGMHFIGYGVPQNYAEAVRWYRQAAEQGHANAQSGLGFMYEIGGGVPHNLVQAHKWYNLAASRASSSDQDLREKAVRSRDRIAARLTPAQLVKAQRLAREWRPRTSTAEPSVHEQRPSTSTAPAPRALNAGAESTRDRIANLQRALRRLGYDPGPVDGILGARTRGAIRAFQADAKLPVNGQISERLESEILAAVVAAEQAHAPAPIRGPGPRGRL